MDATGTIFIADQDNHTTRKVIISTRIITTVTEHRETPGEKFGDRGQGTSAASTSPQGVTSSRAEGLSNGARGDRVAYTWTSKDGYRLKRIQYGFLEGKWVYQLTYQAAARFYFNHDLATFKKLRESFRLLTKPA